MAYLNEVSSSARAFSEEHLLLCEFTHRINNEFASAISAISVAAARSASAEVKAVLAAVADRLHNVAGQLWADFVAEVRCRFFWLVIPSQ